MRPDFTLAPFLSAFLLSHSAWDLLCQRFVDADGLLPFVPAASSVRRTVLERVQSEGGPPLKL